MLRGRAVGLLGILWFGACSFPEYTVPGGGPYSQSCYNGLRDGDEMGVDCGPSCVACPACSNGLKDGAEEGVDCGGSCGVCPTCSDGLQNGSEGDIDCGGTCAERCETDQRCRVDADCASLVCLSVCQPSDCKDGVRNGRETSKDCGGGSCPFCDNGSACLVAADCASGRCENQVCVSPGCTDGVLDGVETDTDCGGNECAPCAATKNCLVGEDCESGLCTAGMTCSAATCSDTVQNQGESAADCGGPGCPPCSTGKSCTKPSDCESVLCQNAICVPMFPNGQPLSKSKWQLQTSETETESGPAQAFDDDVNTCWTSGKAQYDGMYVQLDLGEPRIFFKVLLQITAPPFDQDFPTMLDVFVSNDGVFGDPAASSIGGSQWTWVDFQNAQVGRHVRFQVTTAGQQAWSIGDIALYE